MKTVAMLAIGCLVAGAAVAQPDDGENSLGVYFEPGCTANCADIEQWAGFELYFMLANPTADALRGFEFSWSVAPDPDIVLVVDHILSPGAVNLGDAQNVIVSFDAPRATGPCTLLMIAVVLVVGPVPYDSCITLCPAIPSSLPGCPTFVDADAPGEPVCMTYSTYDPDNGWNVDENGCICSFRFECPGPIEAERRTYGAVKSLFR